ncbi:Fc.00g060690.m01.CDS01 [Cosmosporella sp. VM-42]
MADDTEVTESNLWSSPNHQAPLGPDSRPRTPKTPKTPKTPSGNDRQGEPIDHEAALRKELAGVRNINVAIEGVIATLERAGGNMDTVSKTVNNASVLLNTWTRILSQTEHNQRLILNPSWKGATEDVAEQEAEVLQRQLAAERRAVEEEQRREDLRRRREEEEQRRLVASSTPARGTRGSGTRGTRGRGRATARSGAGSSYLSENTTPSFGSTRGSSNIGRGFGASRGRARGARGT